MHGDFTVKHATRLGKETNFFTRHIEYARSRQYDVNHLQTYEISSMPLYFIKDGHLRKSNKSEFSEEIRKLIPTCPSNVPTSPDMESMVVVDFMGYARKVPIKKLNLRPYHDFANHMWNTINKLSFNAARIDIVFDLHILQSIKQDERNRRGGIEGISTIITFPDQQLPIDMDMFFIKWLTEHYSGNQPLYFGGAHPDDIASCVKIVNGCITLDRLLKCDHEEADDRILFHVSHAIKVDRYQKIVIASPDTDVFISAHHHFSRWIFFGLVELWVLSGKSDSRLAAPLHDIVETMHSNVVDILPAVHSLTGCDTTSKVGTKLSALQTARELGHEYLLTFGRSEISEDMISSADRFLA